MEVDPNELRWLLDGYLQAVVNSDGKLVLGQPTIHPEYAGDDSKFPNDLALIQLPSGTFSNTLPFSQLPPQKGDPVTLAPATVE